MKSYSETYLEQFRNTLERIDLGKVDQAIEWFREIRDQARQAFVCGNGGSATTASHFVTDMIKGASHGRPRRFRITALTDSPSTITAYANDVSFD